MNHPPNLGRLLRLVADLVEETMAIVQSVDAGPIPARSGMPFVITNGIAAFCTEACSVDHHTYGAGCQLAGEFESEAEDPAPRQVYAPLQGPPTIESQLRDRFGTVWQLDYHNDHQQVYARAIAIGSEADPWTTVGDERSWVELLSQGFAPLELLDQDPADHDLYGPWGGRWALMGVRCATAGCAYWSGHSGRHDDGHGNDPSSPQENLGPSSVTPAEAAEVICTCGTPANHQPGCPRYDRLHGTETGARDELPF